MTQEWSSWLDRFEAGCTASRAALAEGRHDRVDLGEPPPDLGPLPVSLEARAQALLRVNALLTAELAAACASAGRQLRLVTAVQHRTGGASFFDSRG